MGVRDRLRRAYERVFPHKINMPSKIIEGDAPGINDGLDYAQLPLLPGYKRAALEKTGQLQEWLEDNARNTYRFQFDTPGRTAADDLILSTAEDPLREWNWQQRQQVLSTCHSAYARNPIAKRAIQYMSAFTVGDGFTLICKNPEVEKVLNDFIDNPDNAIRQFERQAVHQLMIDGELFLRFFEGSGDAKGQVVMVPLRPWEIQYIHTEPGFFRRPLVYRLQPYTQYNTDDPGSTVPVIASDIPATQVIHVAINRLGYELRGKPEMYSALPWLRAHKEWQENRARQNHWRGALLWLVQIAAAAPGVIANKLAQYTKPPTPGSVVVASDKETWTALTNPVGANDASEDGRQLKIMALNGLGGIPEYMTGDGQNATLATTKSQQLPVLMTFREFQTILTEQVWYPVFKRVIQNAMDAGLLGSEVEVMDSLGKNVVGKATGANTTSDVLDAFTVEYEPLGTSEPFTLAQALQIAANGGWISKKTASTEMGYDWNQQQEEIDDERQSDMEAMAKGQIPMPPGQVPPGMEDPNADQPGQGGNDANKAA